MRIKIGLCDQLHESGLKILMGSKDIELIDLSKVKKEDLINHLNDIEILITRSATTMTSETIERAKELKAIVRAGVGIDNIDIDSCSKNGIVVMNVPTANTIAAVELTMCHILNAIRLFPSANYALKNNRRWERERWVGRELKDKTMGIIGFGNIGSRLALRAKAFEMDVIAYDPYVKPSKILDNGIRYAEQLDEILSADIISVHAPKNSETKNAITKEEIAKMKDGVILINCARGGLFNEEDLIEGLKSGKIGFVGLDVFSKEPANDNPLLDFDNVYVTPHIGASTIESQEKIGISAANAAIESARGSSYPNALNLPIKQNELPNFLHPYLELAQKLAFLISQIYKGNIISIDVHAQDKLSDFKETLTTFALMGILKHALGDKVNYINAMFVAKDRGISINSKKKSIESIYKNLIQLNVGIPNDSINVSGCIFDDDKLRIVDINGFSVDIEPSGKMILFKNKDVPGVIGEVGNILGRHNINIADFRLGRNDKKEALSTIIVDNDVPDVVLEELKSIKACLSAIYVVI